MTSVYNGQFYGNIVVVGGTIVVKQHLLKSWV